MGLGMVGEILIFEIFMNMVILRLRFYFALER